MPRITYTAKTFNAEHEAIIERADSIIAGLRAQGFTLTLRQLYYQFVARALIPNTQQSYKRLGSILNDARLAGRIDWEATPTALTLLTHGSNLAKVPGMPATVPMPEPGSVARLVGGHYAVASRTTVGALWLVSAFGDGLHCSCPAGRTGVRCFHCRQVGRYTAQQEAARPPLRVAPPAISALVD